MEVESLALSHFRNYDALNLSLKGFQRIALIGLNAQGKSNFLESLYALAFASSFRASQPLEMVQWQAERTRIQAICRHQRGDEVTLSFEIRRDGKRRVQVNHAYQKRLQDYIGTLKLVLFSQQDLQLITGQPARRRLFMDLLMIQVRPGYYALLQNYHRILRHRNSLLRELKPGLGSRMGAPAQIEQLDLWDIQLSQAAARIINQRKQVLNQLMQLVKQTHVAISGLHEELHAEYRTVSDATPEAIHQALGQRHRQDILRGQTSVGPHRDDLTFRLNQHELRQVGSQGQIRTASLAMKVAELLYARQSLGEYPVLLLDDVFSELDVHRQQMLIEQISHPDLQAVLTTTHLEGPVQRLFEDRGLILHVRQGQVVSA